MEAKASALVVWSLEDLSPEARGKVEMEAMGSASVIWFLEDPELLHFRL